MCTWGVTLLHFSAQRYTLLWDTLCGVTVRLSGAKAAQVELRSGRVASPCRGGSDGEGQGGAAAGVRGRGWPLVHFSAQRYTLLCGIHIKSVKALEDKSEDRVNFREISSAYNQI